jgi:hypothetical protein
MAPVMEHHFDRPWAARRGVETLETDTGLLLARTSVERFASVVARRAARWNRDVLGSTIVVARDFGWVFRLAGHPWSVFLYHDHSSIGTPVELSTQLEAPVIAYDYGDTTGSGDYVFASCGEVRESLRLIDDELKYFSVDGSRPEPGNFFEGVERLFLDHDVYEPGIYPEYFFGDGRSLARLVSGAEVTVGNPGFVLSAGGQEFTSVPEFERVDYLTFGS